MISDHKKRQVVRPAFELINKWGRGDYFPLGPPLGPLPLPGLPALPSLPGFP
jgi:hypothetical protein